MKRPTDVVKEDNRMQELLSRYIETTEKKILREVKDVENILH